MKKTTNILSLITMLILQILLVVVYIQIINEITIMADEKDKTIAKMILFYLPIYFVFLILSEFFSINNLKLGKENIKTYTYIQTLLVSNIPIILVFSIYNHFLFLLFGLIDIILGIINFIFLIVYKEKIRLYTKEKDIEISKINYKKIIIATSSLLLLKVIIDYISFMVKIDKKTTELNKIFSIIILILFVLISIFTIILVTTNIKIQQYKKNNLLKLFSFLSLIYATINIFKYLNIISPIINLLSIILVVICFVATLIYTREKDDILLETKVDN